MNNDILNLPVTRENAEYLIGLVCSWVFGCYNGPKNEHALVEHPETIKQTDFNDIALPQNELKKAQTIIMDLQKLLYIETDYKIQD